MALPISDGCADWCWILCVIRAVLSCARHFSTHVWSVSFEFSKKAFCKETLEIPHTILSLTSRSRRLPKLHVNASFFTAVIYCDKVSPSPCFLLKNWNASYISLVCPLKWASNCSITLSRSSLSLSWANGSVSTSAVTLWSRWYKNISVVAALRVELCEGDVSFPHVTWWFLWYWPISDVRVMAGKLHTVPSGPWICSRPAQAGRGQIQGPLAKHQRVGVKNSGFHT